MLINHNRHKDAKTLLEVWAKLGEPERRSVESFARFLLSQQQPEVAPVAPITEPLNLPAPPGESVVKALKRLKRNYPMIEADMSLLDASAQLVMERMMGGDDAEIIVKMERLFDNYYQNWQAKQMCQDPLPPPDAAT
ncbi:hypothetical protein Mmc1_2466 [Magnetococcus marinus MC-1]|uniref:Uncharacterized protein n=1 Tax=Magnetococcus marinus (strain ATCC BAA-1437 / JCM 17883 / MC-1) TaxID=156889 RepID=A0LAH3_MAGMM|nr:hypothetical protein [Magnetococcus marinus]ABK44966.1 hypothetical protein Mmc1_2466 [Magnetococcus marinus MC-1]